MKQGTIKTLGTVALGAAFVVTAAGVASAAPAAMRLRHHRGAEEPAGEGRRQDRLRAHQVQATANDVKTKLNSHGNKLLGGLQPGSLLGG